MAVTCCTCERRTLADILNWARERGVTCPDQVARETRCGLNCGLCKPFIAYTLATGETRVPWPCPPLPRKEVSR